MMERTVYKRERERMKHDLNIYILFERKYISTQTVVSSKSEWNMIEFQ